MGEHGHPEPAGAGPDRAAALAALRKAAGLERLLGRLRTAGGKDRPTREPGRVSPTLQNPVTHAA